VGFDEISLKGRALRLLAGREHSRAELQRKLRTHETEPGELNRALDELEAKGFINEQRVIESVVHRRSSRLGAARVRQELQAKGLDAQAVAEAVAGLQGSEEARALEVWRRKFGQPPRDAAEHGKQTRFLLNRGFGTELVRRVVRGAAIQDDEV
jgi:regulatory protein